MDLVFSPHLPIVALLLFATQSFEMDSNNVEKTFISLPAVNKVSFNSDAQDRLKHESQMISTSPDTVSTDAVHDQKDSAPSFTNANRIHPSEGVYKNVSSLATLALPLLASLRIHIPSRHSHGHVFKPNIPYSVNKPFGIDGKSLMEETNAQSGHRAFHPVQQRSNTMETSAQRAALYSATSSLGGDSRLSSRTGQNAMYSSMMYRPMWSSNILSWLRLRGNVSPMRVPDVTEELPVSPQLEPVYKDVLRQILIQAIAAVAHQSGQDPEVNSEHGQHVGDNPVTELKRRPSDEDIDIGKTSKRSPTPKSDTSFTMERKRGVLSGKSRVRDLASVNSLMKRTSEARSRSVSTESDGVQPQSTHMTEVGLNSGAGVDPAVFSKFATDTVNFERQSATEIARLDNLLRQLAVAAQSDFASVSAGVTALQQELARTQQQLVQAWKTLNATHVRDADQTTKELVDVKTDVFRLHALLTGVTPLGQSAAQNRTAEVKDARIGPGVDCAALLKSGVNTSGVYDLQPDPSANNTRMTAFCDMETDGGGWTVFQRRQDGSDDFFRGWNSYKHGFGSYLHDHWLGLENIHLLTKYGDNVMRIELADWENETRWAEFSFTRVMDESDGYRILVGGYRGNAGDPFHSLSYDMRMQSMRFSTFDNDNDLDSSGNCALTFTSGWWFNKCFQINLNGVWYGSSRYASPSMNGIVWDLWPEHFNGYSLRRTEMKLRPSDFTAALRQ